MSPIEKLILGTVQLGLSYGINNKTGKPSRIQAIELLDHAFKKGLRLLDTAEAYGDAQSIIGDYHKAIPSQPFSIITKLSAKHLQNGTTLSDLVKADLNQLNVPSLYGYMFHNYQDFQRLYSDLAEEIKTLISKGLIKYFGVSVYTNDEANRVLDAGAVDFIQFPFNLLDNINQRGGIIEKAKSKNIGVHVRSIFLQGLIFKNPVALPEKLSPLQKHIISIQTISSSLKRSMEELALQYVICQHDIDKILIGVDNIPQLDSNLQSVSAEVPEKLVKAINTIEVQEKELLNPTNW